METSAVRVADLHFEHNLWLNELIFYKEEIDILDQRLGELAIVGTSRETKAQIEHFQNQFIRHREVIDEMLHEIRLHEQALSQTVEQEPLAIFRRDFRDHDRMRTDMVRFREIYGELKTEYLEFACAMREVV